MVGLGGGTVTFLTMSANSPFIATDLFFSLRHLIQNHTSSASETTILMLKMKSRVPNFETFIISLHSP